MIQKQRVDDGAVKIVDASELSTIAQINFGVVKDKDGGDVKTNLGREEAVHLPGAAHRSVRSIALACEVEATRATKNGEQMSPAICSSVAMDEQLTVHGGRFVGESEVVHSLPGVEHDIGPSIVGSIAPHARTPRGAASQSASATSRVSGGQAKGPRDHIFLVFFHLSRRLATALVRETLK